MIKLYYNTEGSEPDVICIDECKYEDKPSDGTCIGSANCQKCIACYGWDREEHWVKCLNYALEVLREDTKNKEKDNGDN